MSLIYAGSWCEIYGRLEKSYKKGSLEEALLLDHYSINKRGNEKYSNRTIERLRSVILEFKESRYLQANLGNFLM